MSSPISCALLAIAVVMTGSGRLRAQDAGASDSAAIRAAAGRKLFEGRGLCFSCHGKDGEGALGPTTKLAGRPLVHAKLLVPDIMALIKSGVDSAHSTSGQIMPAAGGARLTDREVESLAWYVLELQQRKKRE